MLTVLLLSTIILPGCKILENKDISCSFEEVTQPDGTKKQILKCEAKAPPPSTTFLLRPITNILATAGIFTYEDWLGFDVSQYEIEFAETTSSTSILQNKISIKVYDSGILLENKLFDSTKVGNVYKFSNPQEVKGWSLQYIDIADDVSINMEVKTTGIPGSQTTSIVRNNGVVLNVMSWQSVDTPVGPPGISDSIGNN